MNPCHWSRVAALSARSSKLGFELSADELALVDAMDAGERVSFDPKLIA